MSELKRRDLDRMYTVGAWGSLFILITQFWLLIPFLCIGLTAAWALAGETEHEEE